jgi:acetylornithine deacetylase
MKNSTDLTSIAVQLLKQLIQIPSFSKEEKEAAECVRQFLTTQQIPFQTRLNNSWCYNLHFDASKPTILLNSHIDTVKAGKGWQTNPFEPTEMDGKLFGLGSNDAGAALVSLLATFLHFNDTPNLPYNLCFAATAEEEISGENGIASIADVTKKCAFGIIGEPTNMEMATAERGLIVIDAVVKGKTGHAARNEGINALYLAMEDIQWIKTYRFEKEDAFLGGIQMTVTIINAGYQHNVVPDACSYVIDIRTVNTYSYEELISILKTHLKADIQPRSLRLKPSSIAPNHPLIAAANALNIPQFGSSTLSDQALLNIPTIKMGPGLSARSHTPEEFIYIHEMEAGIKTYIRFLNEIFKS